MECKYKQKLPSEPRFCQIIQGYCQFLENGYQDGSICPIFHNYNDYDKHWIQEEMNKSDKDEVMINYLEANDDNSTTIDANIGILNIEI